jgi:chromate reductase
MAKYKITVFVVSLRQESWNRKIANVLIKLARASLAPEMINIGDLPLYNEDLEHSMPAEWSAFRTQLKTVQGVLFVTPEYNRSVPAVLKNAIDVGSRPYGKNSWDGKPGAMVSVSPGQIGAFGANHYLRQSLVFISVPRMPQPEAYIGGVAALFDENSNLKNESTKEFLKKYMEGFTNWVQLLAKK